MAQVQWQLVAQLTQRSFAQVRQVVGRAFLQELAPHFHLLVDAGRNLGQAYIDLA